MHARSTTIQARPDDIDAGIRHVTDEVMPTITAMEGCIGLSMMVNRESGRCIATSAWADEASMLASDSALEPVRAQVGSILGGSPQVEEWEIAVLHRDHRTSESTSVRCTWVRVDPAAVDGAIDMFRSETLPRLESLDGFCSASLMVNRSSGRSCASITWDSRRAMEASRESATLLRSSAAEQAGGQIEDVAEFELVLAHLRVPELV